MFILAALGALIFLYLLVGFLLGAIWFAIAKMLEFDNKNAYWSLILNSPIGLVYFLFVVMILWLPACIPLLRHWRHRLKFHKERIPEKTNATWKPVLLRPLYTLKEHIFNWYYIQ